MSIVKPRLRASIPALYRAYVLYPSLTAKEITEIFNVCENTAYRAIRYCAEQAKAEGRESYPLRGKEVRTEWLFACYGWDIESIKQKASEYLTVSGGTL